MVISGSGGGGLTLASGNGVGVGVGVAAGDGAVATGSAGFAGGGGAVGRIWGGATGVREGAGGATTGAGMTATDGSGTGGGAGGNVTSLMPSTVSSDMSVAPGFSGKGTANRTACNPSATKSQGLKSHLTGTGRSFQKRDWGMGCTRFAKSRGLQRLFDSCYQKPVLHIEKDF